MNVLKTVEVVIDENGSVKLLDAVRLAAPRRAIVTILEESPIHAVNETALLSEAALGQDWNRPEEDAAWSYLKAVK
jgi:hypothetical protein